MKSCYVDPKSRAIADLIRLKEREWLLTRINVPFQNRGKGYASTLLKRVLYEADQEGITLTLEVIPSGNLDEQQLTAWYERNGFIKQGNGVMKRVRP